MTYGRGGIATMAMSALDIALWDALGKRTDLYALAAYARAKHNQLVSLSRDEAGFDSNQKNVSVGIQVRF